MTKYIIIALCALALFLGFQNIGLTKKTTKLEGEVKSLTDERDYALEVAEKNKKSLDDYINSCETTLSVLKAAREKDKTLEDAKQATLGRVKATTNPTHKGEPKDAKNSTTGASVFSLDAEYVRMLNEAYCHGNTDDPYCTTNGATDGVRTSNQGSGK